MLGLALLCTLHPAAAHAQRAVDLQVGSWAVAGSNPALYSVGLGRRFWGPLSFNFRGLAVVDAVSSDNSLYGLAPELSLFRGARVLVPYALGGVGLALQPASSPEFAALWYAGLGMEWNPLSWMGLALEASYLAEDGGFHGFWDLRSGDRRGWAGSLRFAVRWGGGPGGSSGTGATGLPPSEYGPSEAGFSTASSAGTDAGSGAALTDRVVNTALGAMGEPYRWGGTSTDEGFDCSGLVWYAYTTNGVSIPRVSRDQARAGQPIARDVSILEPGDILLFANDGTRVTHVGMYVGKGRFIHATSSGGVRVGELVGAGDGSTGWWRERWVGVRRVLG